jgi:putative DNA primase/helicase
MNPDGQPSNCKTSGPSGDDATCPAQITVVPTPLAQVLGVELTRADQIEPKEYEWLWEGWIAKGKFHLLAGAPGTGKTTLAVEFVAIASRGGSWPDGTSCPPIKVLFWTGEDDIDDTILPRLIAASADLENIVFVSGYQEPTGKRAFDPSTDMSELIRKASMLGDVGLVVIDPAVGMITGDSNKAVDVLRGLQGAVQLSGALGCAVIGIHHFSKNSSIRDPLERVVGSYAFGALPRIVMTAAKSEDGTQRVLARSKSNIGRDTGGFAYEIALSEERPRAAYVIWKGPIEGSAASLLAEVIGGASPSQVDTATSWLRGLLTEGPKPQAVIEEQAKVGGHAWRTVQRAKEKLAIQSRKEGATWSWRMPAQEQVCQVRQES